ncbi:MAG: DUF2218 domain-containing protein [Candidatus Velthaea sp.]
MPVHAQALVITPDPSAHAARLARRLGHEFETEWSAESGFVRLPEGSCDLHAWPEGLRLDAFADSGEGLARVEQFIKAQIEREAQPPVQVDWRRRRADT